MGILMEKELIKFIEQNNLSIFNNFKTPLKSINHVFKTKDAKQVYNRLLNIISKNFKFAETSNLFNCFAFDNYGEIKKRQNFFSIYYKSIKTANRDFINNIKKPKKWWKPKYGIIVITDDEKTFTELQNLNMPVKFIVSQQDLEGLDNYEIVQVLGCEDYKRVLENLPQTIFLDSEEEVYLERYLELLSGWKDNLILLKSTSFEDNLVSSSILKITDKLYPILILLEESQREKISKEQIEASLNLINEKVSNDLKEISFSGDSLINVLTRGQLPKNVESIIKSRISESGLNSFLFNIGIPVSLDENELEKLLKKQDSEENTSTAIKIKKNSEILKRVPEMLNELNSLILLYDFILGIIEFSKEKHEFIELSDDLEILDSKNEFLNSPQPVSFNLNSTFRASVLTGANSGGKTTLLEHIIQLIGILNLGITCSGKVKMPYFEEVYYFAKNKGSLNKGAFETLLSQMSEIKAEKRTLILADEIESVTEPGVAGTIVAGSIDYFLKKNCFLVIATHLGKEIKEEIPQKTRIDGIEAKGLDANYNLIVDHNPVLGRLANSTPELIVEKMANSIKNDYFIFLNTMLKRQGSRDK